MTATGVCGGGRARMEDGLIPRRAMSRLCLLALVPGPLALHPSIALAQRPDPNPHMATARRMELTVPQPLLVRADRVIN